MKCNFNLDDIIKYSENLLSDEEKKRVKEHLDVCEKCRRHYGVLKFTETYAKDSSLVSENISKNVMGVIDVNRYSKNKKFWLGGAFHRAMPVIKPILASAAVLAVVMVGAMNIDRFRGVDSNPGSTGPGSNHSAVDPQNTNTGNLPENNSTDQEIEETITITLYYANSNADKVVPEEREIVIGKDTQIERAIFEELQKDPKIAGLYSAIPEGTKLISVSTEGGVCTLNLSREFIDNNPGGSAGELMALYSIVNTLTALPDINEVQFLIEGQKEDVYIHTVFNEPFKKNNDIIEKSTGEIKSEVESRAQIAIQSIKEKNMEKLASMVHPVKGVLFSPYSHIELNKHKVFTKEELRGLLESDKVYNWGDYDGSGEPIELTFKQYYDKFIYDLDFANAEKVAFNEIQQSGNTIVNISDVYPEGKFIDYYFPGIKAGYDGMDWASLRLVFEEYDGQWYLVCIAHGQWTI